MYGHIQISGPFSKFLYEVIEELGLHCYQWAPDPAVISFMQIVNEKYGKGTATWVPIQVF
jgi:hypothetical protein